MLDPRHRVCAAKFCQQKPLYVRVVEHPLDLPYGLCEEHYERWCKKLKFVRIDTDNYKNMLAVSYLLLH